MEINGGIPQHLVQQMDLIRQGQALREAILRLGKPVEIHENPELPDGNMYIVDTSQPTELYEAEEVPRLLIVHKGMLEDAEALKEALDKVLAEEG